MFKLQPKLIFPSTPLDTYLLLPRVSSYCHSQQLYYDLAVHLQGKKEKNLQEGLANKAESIEQRSS